MRVGLSWEVFASATDAGPAWRAVLGDIGTAETLGYDSVWVDESRSGPAACSSPAHFLTYAARTTASVQLRSGPRAVDGAHPVRLAEEVAVLDHFSRGRAGLCFAAASRQDASTDRVHETVDFVRTAWQVDEFRYRGAHVRFPTHTPDDAPAGSSEPDGRGEYVPQWERGPAIPDFLAITPKPYATWPPVCIEVSDDDTLEWAAAHGVSPYLGADVDTDQATDRLGRYQDALERHGVPRWAVEPVLERRMALDGDGDARTLGGSPRDLVRRIRSIKLDTAVSHLVWRLTDDQTGRADQLWRFAGEVQPLLQA